MRLIIPVSFELLSLIMGREVMTNFCGEEVPSLAIFEQEKCVEIMLISSNLTSNFHNLCGRSSF